MTKYIQAVLLLILSISLSFNSPQDVIKVVEKVKIEKKYLLGKINANNDEHFTRIEKPFTGKDNMYMLQQAYKAYKEMYASAAKEGLDLKIVSAFRSFQHQKYIWEAKWTGERKVLGHDLSRKYPNAEERARVILMFSSMPGTSRHHWGTDVDIYSVEDKDFLSGKGKKIYNWLVKHAYEFNYCQVYTPKPSSRPKGYEEEKWHWSYKPIAEVYLEEYKKHISYHDIEGFKGDRVAKQINVIEEYVLGINPNCKKSCK